ncbi:hypothetical protein [Brevundimonas olei]|uniref:hypothetical protein n=1 Tax=Brevundimonas olei TaxID=657642 RepID=UPI0031D7A61A
MFRSLPKPQSFEQGQRLAFGWFLVGSGIFAGLVGVSLTVFFGWLAFKFVANRELILLILAGGFAAYLTAMIVVMLSLAVGGPVGRFKVNASKEGVGFEASDDQISESVNDDRP